VTEQAWYLIRNDFAHMGLVSNLVLGSTVLLLQKHGYQVVINAYLVCADVPTRVCKRIATALRRLDATQRKECSMLIGLCGRVLHEEVIEVEVHSEADKEYYKSRYDLEEVHETLLSRVESSVETINRLAWYSTVVLHSNTRVLQQMMRIKRSLNVMPVRVCTDSLTYEKMPLPFGGSGLDRFTDEYWHHEPVRTVTPVQWGRVDADFRSDYGPAEPMWAAQTFNGPPGTGKTHAALELRPDIRCTSTNKGAVRLGGCTLHTLFRCGTGDLWYRLPDLSSLADKHLLLFIDEAQAVPRKMLAAVQWAMLRKPDLRVVFALDVDQLEPINENPYPRSLLAMHGEVRTLSRNWRNDTGVVELRARVLDGWVPPPTAGVDDPIRLASQHIAFTNSTCQIVNSRIAEGLGFSAYSEAGTRVIVKGRPRSKTDLPLACNYILEGMGADKFRVVDTGDIVTLPPAAQRRWQLDWAYCLTVHRTIGEGFRDVTVWDIDRMTPRVLYTAVCRAHDIRLLELRTSPSH
jgi:hypothetical protein